MTKTLPGADIRSYYTAIGVSVPEWARTEATVRCFADPAAHRRDDRDPSCSVNLEHGAWQCHACGAKGGAFDAALARGYTRREAIDLMVAYGLARHHPRRHAKRTLKACLRPNCARRDGPLSLLTTGADVARWQAALAAKPDLIAELTRDRGWLYATMLELKLGVDHGRITIPAYDHRGDLIGLLRYQPWANSAEPKIVADAGSRRVLVPQPAAEPSTWVLLVEGEPDMIAARSRGLPAIAVPGTGCWRTEWAEQFRSRTVTIAADADRQGRRLSAEVAADLAEHADTAAVIDVAPTREDGYDLTNWLLKRHAASPRDIQRELIAMANPHASGTMG